MSEKPEALRLAEYHECAGDLHSIQTAAELRRLHAQRDELLTALRGLLSYANVLEMRLLDADGEHRAMQQARAAIKAVEGETNGQA